MDAGCLWFLIFLFFTFHCYTIMLAAYVGYLFIINPSAGLVAMPFLFILLLLLAGVPCVARVNRVTISQNTQ